METSLATTSHQHLAESTLSALDSMTSNDAPSSHLFKMEDLHTTASSPAPSAFDHSTPSFSQASPPPVIIQSKAAKKRKSWGQELPEPKTTLPPRKRAKTDDEKEQRRIERIKRNRAAAHNSRERKRQETETLAVLLAKANAELDAYRKLHGPLPASIVLPEVTICTEDADTPAPSLTESRDTIDDSAPSPATEVNELNDTSDFNPIKQEEPLDTPFDTHFHPAYLSALAGKPSNGASAFLPLDLTQHSAAMLCDLPCRSSRSPKATSLIPPRTPSSRTSATFWTSLILLTLTTQLQATYKILLLAFWSRFPSRMAAMMRASAARSSRSISSSTTRRSVSRSTPRRLALPSAATGRGAPRAERPRASRVATAEELGAVGLASVRDENGGGLECVNRESSTSDGGDEKDGVRRGSGD